jgi:hypothetical protein
LPSKSRLIGAAQYKCFYEVLVVDVIFIKTVLMPYTYWCCSLVLSLNLTTFCIKNRQEKLQEIKLFKDIRIKLFSRASEGK